jgi:hypothetical protein
MKRYTPVPYDDLRGDGPQTLWGTVKNLDVGQRVLLDGSRSEHYAQQAIYRAGVRLGRKYHSLRVPEGIWVMREE